MINIIGVQGIPLIKPGDNIGRIILEKIKDNNLSLEDGDILVIAQTIISKSLGSVVDLKKITPSKKALELYEQHLKKTKNKGIPIKEPELIQLILDESKEILKVEHVIIVETKHGFVCANAGIDKSNIEGESNIALLPENSDKEAERIRYILKKLTNKDVAIIISDSFGRPFRVGSVGVALGVSGIRAILDKRGSKDLFGHKLQSTIIGQVDNLASAAQLVMGETDEGLPVILIRGYDFEQVEKTSIIPILREKEMDLFIGKDDLVQFKNLLKERRSYKFEFDSKNVDEKLILKCIDLARWAPSAHNGQFWRYLLLEKGKIRTRLIESMNTKLREDLQEDGKSETFIQGKINKTRKNFLKAPYLILLCLDKNDLGKYPDSKRAENEFILGVQSISASATYLLLAFQMEKLAACWYCAPLFSKDIIKNKLDLPDSYVPMAFITVGYPNQQPKAPPRKGLENIIFKCKK